MARIIIILAIFGVVGGGIAWLIYNPPSRDSGEFRYIESELRKFDPGKIVFDEQLRMNLVGDELLVTLHKGISEKDLEGIISGLKLEAKIVGRIPSFNQVQLEVTNPKRLHETRARLAKHPYVAAVGLAIPLTINIDFNDPALVSPDTTDDWGLQRINAPAAWEVTTGGAVVAVLDSGTKVEHEEMSGKTTGAYSFFTSSGDMQEGEVTVLVQGGTMQSWITGHGTHVAITVAGAADNGLGTAGVAPDSPIMPIQALGYVPEMQAITGTPAFVSDGIARAIGNGAKVINMSIGFGVPEELVSAWRNAWTAEEKQEIEQLIMEGTIALLDNFRAAIDQAQASGVILVKAAGNDDYPAKWDSFCYSKKVIAVAATTPGDQRADFSNYGEYTTVSAPGTEIWSGFPNPAEQYKYLQGTSMASPHVAGVVGLIKTLEPDYTFEQVRDLLVSTGESLSTDEPIGPMINAQAAVEALKKKQEEGDDGEKEDPPTPEPPLIPDPPCPPAKPDLPPNPDDILNSPEPWTNADIQRLIDLWLSISVPKTASGPPPEVGPWYYDKYGRMLNHKTAFANMPPDWAGYRHKFLWGHAKDYNSQSHGTLYEFIVGMLRSGSFTPAPPKIPDPKAPDDDGGSDSGGDTDVDVDEVVGDVMIAKDPRDIVDIVMRAVKERRFEWLYDISSNRTRVAMRELFEEAFRTPIREAQRAGTITAEQRERLRSMGFESIDALLRASEREVLFVVGRAMPAEDMNMPDWVQTVRVDYDPGGRSGTLVTLDSEGKEESVDVVFEGGGWRFDIPDEME